MLLRNSDWFRAVQFLCRAKLKSLIPYKKWMFFFHPISRKQLKRYFINQLIRLSLLINSEVFHTQIYTDSSDNKFTGNLKIPLIVGKSASFWLKFGKNDAIKDIN